MQTIFVPYDIMIVKQLLKLYQQCKINCFIFGGFFITKMLPKNQNLVKSIDLRTSFLDSTKKQRMII